MIVIHKILIPLILLLLCYRISFSQIGSIKGAYSQGMGNTTLSDSSAFSTWNNPASLNTDKIQLGINTTNRFLIPNLFDHSFSIGYPISNKLLFSGGVNYFGDNLYNEFEGKLNGIYRFSSVSSSLSLSYLQTNATEELNTRTIGVSLSSNVAITENFTAGVLAYNLNRPRNGFGENDYHPSFIRFAISYQLVKDILLVGEVEKDFLLPFNYKTGLRYSLSKQINIMVGARFPQASIHLGTAISILDNLKIAFSLLWQNQLGSTQNIGMEYFPIKKAPAID